MSASKVLDLAQRQGLLEPKVIAELRRQVAESKFVVTPEAIAKVLVDHGHLTPFQARKLVNSALEEPAEPAAESEPASPPPKAKRIASDELILADESSGDLSAQNQPSPAADEDDVVMMEAVDASPPPVSKPQKKPVFSPPKPPQSKHEDRFAPPPRPSAAKTVAEDFADVESAPTSSQPVSKPTTSPKPARTKSAQWKAAPPAPPPVAPADALVPLDPSVPSAKSSPTLTPFPPEPGLSSSPAAPLGDLFADPLALPADPLVTKGGAELPGRKKKHNVWDSPLLLVGGGLLGVMLVAFGLLYYSLTRGSAAEFLAKADEKYESGAYTDAIQLYESFLEKYPKNPNMSKAKVRLGMAELRQVSSDGQNPKQGLTTAKRVLPKIESEEKFDDARVELATLLPDIAEGFATMAAEASDTAQKEALIAQADEAMKLVNNAAYLPPSLRKERETRISAILDKLKVAQRSIEQDKELGITLEKIAAAEKQGDAAAAYQLRSDLLKVYPALATHASLLAAIRGVGERERSLVKVDPEVVAAANDDPQAGGPRLVLAVRSGPAPAAAPGRIAFVQIEGAVYGIDADCGRILWRRHVGYQTLVQPQPASRDAAADAIVSDARTHELLRLEGASGKVVWRQAIGQPFFAPALTDERVFVTTQAGRILQLDLATGAIKGSAQLPQAASVGAAVDGRQSRLVQLGLHSTLFVLSGKTLECTETYYLGHHPGAILVPPVAILDHVIAVESPADDYTLLHVLAPDAESKRLVEAGKPIRLRGRVVMPLSVSGRRAVAMTDLGQIAVYEIDASNKQQPLRLVAALEPTERTPVGGFYTADATRLWLAGRRCMMFEIQPAVQQLARKWSQYQDDAFIAPLVTLGNVLIHTRRRPGLPGVIVTGCTAASGAPLWETQLTVPVAALVPAPGRKVVDAVTVQGRVFPISSDAWKTGVIDAPAFPLPQGSAGSIWPELASDASGQSVAWTETQPAGRAFAYDPASGSPPASVALSESGAATAGTLWGKNLIVPLKSGEVALVDLAAGKPATLPFQPQLSPNSVPAWTRPALLPDASAFIIGDGRNTIYRVAVKAQPKEHLEAIAEETLALEIRGALVSSGDTIYGLTRTDSGEAVVAIDPQTLKAGNHWDLHGKPQFVLTGAQGVAFVATETDGLLCLEGGQKLRWQATLAHGPLAGPPIPIAAEEVFLLHQDSTVARVNLATGAEIAHAKIGEPLGRAACLVGNQLFVSASDGTIVRAPLPQ
jgi:tetratricopeptide (TPR) repeat protein